MFASVVRCFARIVDGQDLLEYGLLCSLIALFALGAVTLLCVACVTLFYKELALTSFDPNLATTLGYPADLFHYGIVVLVAVAAIASFEAVG